MTEFEKMRREEFVTVASSGQAVWWRRISLLIQSLLAILVGLSEG